MWDMEREGGEGLTRLRGPKDVNSSQGSNFRFAAVFTSSNPCFVDVDACSVGDGSSLSVFVSDCDRLVLC